METTESLPGRCARTLEPWQPFLAILWCEIAFKFSTTAAGIWPQVLLIALFSLAAGTLVRLVASALPTQGANKVAKLVIMALFALCCTVEYFVYRKFKLLYDLNTVLFGAGDAAGGFADQIVSLVLSPAGIAHILLFLAPVVLYGVFGCGEQTRRGDGLAWRVRMARDAALAEMVALLLVSSIGNFAAVFAERYSFQGATESFGLLWALGKEVGNALGGGRQVSFTEQGPADTSDEGKDTDASRDEDGKENEEALRDEAERRDADEGDERPSQKPPTYEDNVSDIDFEALADTTSGTWADLDRYVASLEPSSQNEMTGRYAGYNLVFITAEALSSEAIRPDTTPTLWRMATKGVQAKEYYQFDSAGTTGGECANLFGLLATEGGSSVKMCSDHNMYLTIGNALNREGYDGWAFHNNTYTYYGRDATHNNLGYSEGYMGYGNGMEQWVTWQWPQSDLEMVKGTFENLYGTHEHEPFNVYYMSVSGHSDYRPGENAMGDKHWDSVEGLPYSDSVKGYLAANVELDQAMEYLLGALEDEGMLDHTLIVIGADHFPYGLDDDGPLGQLPLLSELYGFDVTTYFERDHNRLILWALDMEDDDPIEVEGPMQSIDVLPTLLNLFGVEWDSRLLPGRDVFSDKPALVFDLNYDWRTELGTYYAGTGTFVPEEGAQVADDYVGRINTDVANRINFCHAVLTSDYYAHVFGPNPDVHAVHDEARGRLEDEVAREREKKETTKDEDERADAGRSENSTDKDDADGTKSSAKADAGNARDTSEESGKANDKSSK